MMTRFTRLRAAGSFEARLSFRFGTRQTITECLLRCRVLPDISVQAVLFLLLLGFQASCHQGTAIDGKSTS